MEKSGIKCVVWDLDHTLWEGVLLEDPEVRVKPEVVETIRTLDSRGILHSIASKNDRETALRKLEALGLAEYFLAPEIGWGAKSESVKRIAASLNIGIDALAFVDDQPFEREEVAATHPAVWCVDAADAASLVGAPRCTPRMITSDARQRRSMYRADLQRKEEEERFDGPSEAFLAGLDMRLRISPAQEEDLTRAEELTVRTNQLNATGITYGYDELDAYRRSADHALLMAELHDRFGTYGKIGLVLVEKGAPRWTIKLLLMSCRVMSRGVGNILLAHVMNRAKEHGAELVADFVHTGKNRMMFVAYRFAGFIEAGEAGGVVKLAHALDKIPAFPPYVRVEVDEGS